MQNASPVKEIPDSDQAYINYPIAKRQHYVSNTNIKTRKRSGKQSKFNALNRGIIGTNMNSGTQINAETP